MILISHRGNLNGPNRDQENHPDYIKSALSAGFNVELDLWKIENKLYLGHDGPQFLIKESFICDTRFWVHAKNIDAAFHLTHLKMIHWFFHDQDDCVLTSSGFLWTFPGKKLTNKSIAVMPERVSEPYDLSNCYGICTDYPYNYKQ